MQITLIFTCSQLQEPVTGTAVIYADTTSGTFLRSVPYAAVSVRNTTPNVTGSSMSKTLSTKWIVLRAAETPLKSILTVGTV